MTVLFVSTITVHLLLLFLQTGGTNSGNELPVLLLLFYLCLLKLFLCWPVIACKCSPLSPAVADAVASLCQMLAFEVVSSFPSSIYSTVLSGVSLPMLPRWKRFKMQKKEEKAALFSAAAQTDCCQLINKREKMHKTADAVY